MRYETPRVDPQSRPPESGNRFRIRKTTYLSLRSDIEDPKRKRCLGKNTNKNTNKNKNKNYTIAR